MIDTYEAPSGIEIRNGIGGESCGGPCESGTYGEEIGGFGLSLFYDKTGGGPMVVGRNRSPLTTHQVVGFQTIDADSHRRWGNKRNQATNMQARTCDVSAGTPIPELTGTNR